MTDLKSLALLVTGLTVLVAVQAQASLATYGTRESFNTQGTIVYNSDFTDFGPAGYLPGDPFTRGDVTYHSTQNVTFGNETMYTTTEPLIGNVYWTPILGDIATTPKYSMFGFDIGNWKDIPITIIVNTTLSTYTYPDLTIAPGSLHFKGFIASPGEYFTGFNIIGSVGNLPGITHVTLGHVTPVPEPSTFIAAALLLIPFGATAVRRFRR
ncbi:MAG: hypothetical protein AB9869_05410 [Verrucomicrobiia bacterium]